VRNDQKLWVVNVRVSAVFTAHNGFCQYHLLQVNCLQFPVNEPSFQKYGSE